MRDHLLCAVLLLAFLFPWHARADGVAVIMHADIAPYRVAIEGFRQEIRLPMQQYDLSAGDREEIATAVRKQKPELLFVLGKSSLAFVRSLRLGIPVVIAFVLHPGVLRDNETGVAMIIPARDQLATLLEIAPDVKTIGAVYDPNKSGTLIAQIRQACAQRHLRLIATPVTSHREAAQANANLASRVGAMWMVPDTTVLTKATFRQLVGLSWRNTIPLIGLAPKHVRAGCLFALSFDSRAIGEQAGALGRRVMDIPFSTELTVLEPPVTHHLSINRRAVSRLGITLSSHILRRVDQFYPANEERVNR